MKIMITLHNSSNCELDSKTCEIEEGPDNDDAVNNAASEVIEHWILSVGDTIRIVQGGNDATAPAKLFEIRTGGVYFFRGSLDAACAELNIEKFAVERTLKQSDRYLTQRNGITYTIQEAAR